MKSIIVAFLAIIATVSAVNNLKVCPSQVKKPAEEDITIGSCSKPPCILKRGTTINVAYKFKTDEDINKCENEVFGIISGIPLPFVGVHTTDCCPYIYNESGEKVGCPIKAGQPYLYKNEIKVLSLYPTVRLTVEWGLKNIAKNNQFFCYQVDAKITN